MMEGDVHTVLDMLTLAATGAVIFLMMTNTQATYQADKDTLWEVFIVRLPNFATAACGVYVSLSFVGYVCASYHVLAMCG